MRKRRRRTRRKRKSRRLSNDQALESAQARSAARPASERLGVFYARGPVFGLGATREEESGHDQPDKATAREEEAEAGAQAEIALAVHGQGEPQQLTVHGRTLRLKGKTKAWFDGGQYYVENLKTERATGCAGCKGGKCIHATGTLVTTYSVTTTVKLPKVSDYPKLTPCQKKRIQEAIDKVLTPHEQEHVKAFKTYNGTTRRKFDLTLCRKKLKATIKAMFKAEERARRIAAQAASDALDPFYVDADLDCEDESASAGGEETPGETTSEESTGPESDESDKRAQAHEAKDRSEELEEE